jgi:hypothetical protein
VSRQDFKRVHPAGHPDRREMAQDYNRLLGEVEALNRLTAAGGSGVTRVAGGFVITSDQFNELEARITGAPTGSAYPWQEVYWDDASAAYRDGDRSGTAAVIPLREINGDTGVAVGTRVRAWLSPGEGSYLFEYRSTMGGGGTTHNLLSATHPDTVVGSPARGAIVRGNSTPAWALYALGAANDYLGSDGSDLVYRTPAGGGQVLGTGRTLASTSPVSVSGVIGGSGDLSSDRTVGLAGLSGLGTANYVVGVNAGATGWEYKQLVAGANVTITHGVTTIQISASVAAAGHALLSATHTDTIASTPVAGGLIYATATPAWAQLGIGTAGQVLTVSAGPTLLPTWATPTAVAHDLLSATHGDTLAASVQVGDLVFGNSTPKWARLALGTAGQTLVVSPGPTSLPTWTTQNLLSASHPDTVPGPPVQGDLIYANSTPAWTKRAIGTSGQFLQVAGNEPVWGDGPAPGGKDLHHWRNVGTGGTLGTRLYSVASLSAAADLGSYAFLADRLYAAPFICPKAITLDQLIIRVTVAGSATANARLGIYESTSETNLYPGARVVDGGEVDCSSTGVKTATISTSLTAGKLYFLCVLFEEAFSILGTDGVGIPGVLGYDENPNVGDQATVCIRATQAYGALPATFPATHDRLQPSTGEETPLVFVRLSA